MKPLPLTTVATAVHPAGVKASPLDLAITVWSAAVAVAEAPAAVVAAEAAAATILTAVAAAAVVATILVAAADGPALPEPEVMEAITTAVMEDLMWTGSIVKLISFSCKKQEI